MYGADRRLLFFLCVVSLFGLVNATPARAQGRENSLVNRLEALEARVAALENLDVPVDIPVHCAEGQTVTDALVLARKYTGGITITVHGTCIENVTVTLAFVTIRGLAGADAAIHARNATFATLRAGSNAVVSLRDIDLTGGAVGLLADNGGAAFTSGNVTIAGNATGVRVDLNSQVRLGGNTIVENNTGDAVTAWNGGSILILGGQIRNNTGHGLRLQRAAGNVTGGAVVTGNGGGFGVMGVYAGSVLTLGSARIDNNLGPRAGVFLVGGSTLWLEAGARITGNAGNGVSALDTSVVGKLRSTTDVKVTGNAGWGISCSPSPSVAQLTSFPPVGQHIDLSGNALGTHNCPSSPGAPVP